VTVSIYAYLHILSTPQLAFCCSRAKIVGMSEAGTNNREKPLNPGWANLKPTKPGEVRNPHGRPLGSRNKLAEAFVADMYQAWEADGSKAIQEMIKRKPWEFVKIAAGLMPQKLEITNKFQSLPDAELAATLTRALKDITPRADGRPPSGRIGNQRGIIEATAEPVRTLSEADSFPHGGSSPSGTAIDGGQSAGEDLRRRS
jgi:hypothetical protein